MKTPRPLILPRRQAPLRGPIASLATAVASTAIALTAPACGDTPHTTVVIENRYAAPSPSSLVIYDAYWHSVSFEGSAIRQGASSDPQDTLPASATTAYVLLARGWDPASATPPAAFVVLQSRAGFELHLDEALHIPVEDATFAGNCAAGSVLTQEQADFITQRVFPGRFGGVKYDASTCTTTKAGVASAP